MTPPRPVSEDDAPRRRYVDSHPDLIQRAPLAVAVATLIGLIFSFGVNYNKLTSLRDDFNAYVSNTSSTYVRRDVQDEQTQNLQAEIEMLRYEIQDLKTTLNARPPARAASNPRFEQK